MNFLCICLCPAIDATVRTDAWPTDGCVIKNAVDTFAPGGKTVNVARWLGIRSRAGTLVPLSGTTAVGTPAGTTLPSGTTVACGGLLGEDNAVLFEKELAKYGIEDRFVRVPGSTRVNEMFVTPQGSFKVNRPAFPGVSTEGLASRVSRLDGADVVILSGSLPADFPADSYRGLVAAAKAAGAKVVLDASGTALVEGVKAHPDVIKPNAEECAALIGFVPKTPDDFRRATEALKAFCDYPIISDGGNGCWFDGEFVAAPKVDVLDTTAAGDTLLAEWCWRSWGEVEKVERQLKHSNTQTLKHSNTQTLKHSNTQTLKHFSACLWAVAAGSAACTMPGGEPPDPAVVEALKREIERG